MKKERGDSEMELRLMDAETKGAIIESISAYRVRMADAS